MSKSFSKVFNAPTIENTTIITLSTIGVLKTFETELIMYFPEVEYIFDKGENIFESMGYIITIIKDLIEFY